jgi:flagellar motor switch protein FliN/FliY
MSDENEEMGGDDQDAMADEWAAALAEQTTDAADEMDVSAVAFDELADESPASKDPKLDVIMDIPVTLSMEVGNTDISIRNLLQLSQGSVVELDRVAGEPLDVLVNGTLIAHGEVVVVNERYGIRLTDVISPQERIKRLK